MQNPTKETSSVSAPGENIAENSSKCGASGGGGNSDKMGNSFENFVMANGLGLQCSKALLSRTIADVPPSSADAAATRNNAIGDGVDGQQQQGKSAKATAQERSNAPPSKCSCYFLCFRSNELQNFLSKLESRDNVMWYIRILFLIFCAMFATGILVHFVDNGGYSKVESRNVSRKFPIFREDGYIAVFKDYCKSVWF